MPVIPAGCKQEGLILIWADCWLFARRDGQSHFSAAEPSLFHLIKTRSQQTRFTEEKKDVRPGSAEHVRAVSRD